MLSVPLSPGQDVLGYWSGTALGCHKPSSGKTGNPRRGMPRVPGNFFLREARVDARGIGLGRVACWAALRLPQEDASRARGAVTRVRQPKVAA